jgi:hypothetical protein
MKVADVSCFIAMTSVPQALSADYSDRGIR